MVAEVNTAGIIDKSNSGQGNSDFPVSVVVFVVVDYQPHLDMTDLK